MGPFVVYCVGLPFCEECAFVLPMPRVGAGDSEATLLLQTMAL